MLSEQIELAGYRRMASMLLMDSIKVLESSPPHRRPGETTHDYGLRWCLWARNKAFEIRFFKDPERAAQWFDVAGVDWEQSVIQLESRGLFQDPRELIPLNAKGKPLFSCE